MKFVYFGYDFLLHAVRHLIDEGHELAGIFTFECDNLFNFNTGTHALAAAYNVTITEERPTAEALQAYIDQGVDCFICGGYPHKIPPIDESKAYGINVHPAYLPKGRGIMPTPFIITEAPEAAGVTIHKLTQSFDAGDILVQEKFELSAHDCVETYSARVAKTVPDMLSDILKNLPAAWSAATPQDETQATHYPLPSDQMRMLDYTLPVMEIDRTARAFGRFGTITQFGENLYVVYALTVWKEAHRYEAGTIIWDGCGREALVAAKDGFVCLKDFQALEIPQKQSAQ